MRNIKPLLFVLATLYGSAAIAADAAAAPAAKPAGDLKVAVVDAMGALQASEQYTKAIADLEKDTAADKAKLTKWQAELKTCQQKLQTDAQTMSATDLAKMKSDCEAKYRDYQSLGQTFQKTVNERQQAILQDMGPKFQRAVDAVAKEIGADMVLTKDAMLFVRPALEVTDKVTIKLNTLK